MTTQTNAQLRERIVPILRELYGHGRTAGWGTRTDLVENAADQIIALISPPAPGSSGLLQERVKAVREKQGLSIRALGDLTGLNFYTLARFERGEGDLSAENKATLRDWLKILEPKPASPDPDREAIESGLNNPKVSFNLRNNIKVPVESALTTGGWRSIDSAPRDGSRVLLFVPPYGPSTGHYEPSRSNWGPNASLWVAHSVLNKEAGPTHWMPLPEPPTSKPDTGE